MIRKGSIRGTHLILNHMCHGIVDKVNVFGLVNSCPWASQKNLEGLSSQLCWRLTGGRRCSSDEHEEKQIPLRMDGMNQLHQQQGISQCFTNVGILKHSVDRCYGNRSPCLPRQGQERHERDPTLLKHGRNDPGGRCWRTRWCRPAEGF
ncbi:hypothetical protein VULLAG_LOCUS8442 [Vulpes lagopus]